MCKTWNFKNIKQPWHKESWDQTKIILANEIRNVMPVLDKNFITSEIGRAHRVKGSFLSRLNPVSSKLQKKKKDDILIIVSQIYSAALTKQHNDAW